MSSKALTATGTEAARLAHRRRGVADRLSARARADRAPGHILTHIARGRSGRGGDAHGPHPRGLTPAGTLVYPEPPDYLKGGRFSPGLALRVFGPGAIIASITIGSGETVFASRGGAVFGYAIMWTFILGAILKAALAYSQNRYITLTGEHPMTRWAYLFPGPRGWFPLLLGALSIAAFPSWAGGLSVALGDLMSQVTAVGSGPLWATGLLVVAGGLAWIGGYAWMERAQILLIVFMLIAIVIGTFVAAPDWLAALVGLVPQAPSYAPWLQEAYADIAARPVWVEVATYIGAIGGGTYDYIGYTGMMREKNWGLLGRDDILDVADRFRGLPRQERLPISDAPEEVAKGRAWARAPLGDVLVSFIAMALFAILFIVNGANILHDQQLVPAENDVLTHQAQFLTVVHPAMEYLYYLAIFAAFFGTLYGLWEVYSYTTYESIGAVFPRVHRAGYRSVRKYVYAYVFIGGLILAWTVGELVVIVTPASIVGGVLTGGIFCLALLWTEKRMLPPAYRLRGFAYWWVMVAGVLLTLLGLVSIYELFAGL
jgi:hypothetical protein